MSTQKPTGPVQADHIDHKDDDERSPARAKDQAAEDKGKPSDDQPGADGFASAGATEDTYD
jgi:hypothetical protein